MGEEGGVNLYGFVGNDPVNKVDPKGLQSIIMPAIQDIVFELGEDIAGATAGGIAGQVCAEIFCKLKQVPNQEMVDLKCMSVIPKLGLSFGAGYSSTTNYDGCRNVCFKITHHKNYKKKCDICDPKPPCK